MAAPKKVRIGDLLVEHRIISEAQLSAALAEQKKSGRKLGRVLIDHGYVQEDALLKLLSEQLDMPYIDLGTFELNPSVVQLLPETYARRYRALVLKETPTGLLVGMGDPTDIFAFDELARVLKRPLTLAVVKESDLLHAIDQMYEHGAQIRNLASEIGQDLSENAFDLGNLTAESSQSDAPVVKLLQTIFEDAVRAKASDIHIEPDEDVLRIRRRVDGVLHEQVMDEKRIAAALVSRLKLMAGGDISERRKPQDGRFTLKVQDTQIDVRMATVPTQNGEAAVLRLLDQDAGRFNLDDLGMPEAVLTSFRRQIHKPHGLVLVTGPTGSGKTTTLYAALGELNRPQKKIITVEDPVEIQMPRVNQVQVNPKIGLGFAEVLRTTLRLDPDIILVGEIRDQETGEIALRASLTGHLVLSTLHTNDAVSSAIRLIDMGLEPYLVASSVSAIVAQRLVRTLCEGCRTEHTPTAAEHAWLEALEGRDPTPVTFHEGTGCNRCNHTGYRGRTGVYEILELNSELIDALRQNDQSAFERICRAESRYRPLVHHALELAGQGRTSLEEVMRLTGWIE
ncbi:GspE/PulE family protein [Thiohalobacter thiocyanaticus]|uniref:Type II/IV secretion system protein n=1 Tax=Thiohalobacter thiocyanaticus TaxID=585455 RepID=A0A426QJQ4_9GAMM|nr:GspE/PulE family protein [Thiohalobacter thiocyanaticus]RRQ22002.1 type II/IV secretion system protein [Thiohalobacter thiocyanaticus]